MSRGRFAPRGVAAILADSLAIEFDHYAAGAPYECRGDFAVVCITGPLMQHANPCWDSYEAIAQRIAAAAASDRQAILLRIASPGGQVAGCFELAKDIRKLVGGKRVLAYVDGLAASAAYALACSAEQIFVGASGVVGSIGCMQLAVDETVADRNAGLGFEIFTSGARKADGNPHIVMSDGARAAIQAGVDDMAGTFFELVAASRLLSTKTVSGFQAACFIGAKAVAVGLADGVKTFEEVVSSGVQITAQSGPTEAPMADMTDEEKAKAALKAVAEGDDEAAAARAKKALAAYEADDEEKKDDEDKPKSESEDDGEKPKDDEDKPKEEAKASLALAAQVQSLSAWKQAQEEKVERAELMAKRPDLAADVVAFLERQPLSVVRDAVKSLPRGAAKSPVAAARAAISVQPTLAAQAHDATGGDRLPPEEARELDIAMGLAKRTQAIRHEGNRMYLGVMTPNEARAEIARRENEKKGAAK
jgi:ClpP class serine protease